MIGPLRKRHRLTVTALAVVLPVLFAAGLLVRRPPPLMQQIPESLEPLPESFPVALFEADTLWGDLGVATRLRADGSPATRLAVELQPTVELRAPDVLVYWHAGAAPVAGSVPPDAYLLGTLAGTQTRRFVLPDSALHTDGRLTLYSLAHQEVLATAPLSTRTP